jgi:hypothetical protein
MLAPDGRKASITAPAERYSTLYLGLKALPWDISPSPKANLMARAAEGGAKGERRGGEKKKGKCRFGSADE